MSPTPEVEVERLHAVIRGLDEEAGLLQGEAARLRGEIDALREERETLLTRVEELEKEAGEALDYIAEYAREAQEWLKAHKP